LAHVCFDVNVPTSVGCLFCTALLAYPYAYAALPASYPEDDGSYWPGKYENTIPEVAKTVYSSHPEDDGSYWPGKYDNSELPAYPVVYRHY